MHSFTYNFYVNKAANKTHVDPMERLPWGSDGDCFCCSGIGDMSVREISTPSTAYEDLSSLTCYPTHPSETLPTIFVPMTTEAEDWERRGEGTIRKKELSGFLGHWSRALQWFVFMLPGELPATYPLRK